MGTAAHTLPGFDGRGPEDDQASNTRLILTPPPHFAILPRPLGISLIAQFLRIAIIRTRPLLLTHP